MAGGSPQPVLRHIHVLATGADGMTDAPLLEQFTARRDEAAFAALVERHGAMVLGVCRRVLPDVHAAEDVFQAVFLVLARKASAIRKRESLGSWLHGVALRLAHKAKAQAARAARPDERPQPAISDPLDEITWREVQQVLDAELARLPERYRLPLVLCYLEGRTRDEAAAQLGWTSQKVKGQLERGRERLRRRLVQRGVALSAALSASILADRAGAAVPPLLAVAIVPAAVKFSAGQPAAACGVSAVVATLAEGAVKKMTATIWKTVAALLLLGGAVGTGVFAVPGQKPPPDKTDAAGAKAPPAKEQPPLRATFIEERGGKPPMRSYQVKLELTNVRNQPVWLLLGNYGDEPLQPDGKFTADLGGVPQTFTGRFFDGDKNKGRGKVIEISFIGKRGFRAFHLPPRSAVQFDNFGVEAWSEVRAIEVWEVSALKMNGKTPLQDWLPYPTMSDQSARIAANTDWDSLDWDRKTQRSRTDYPNEKITSVDATVLKKWMVPIEGMPPAKPLVAAADAGPLGTAPNPGDVAPDWRESRTFKTAGDLARLTFSPDGRTLAASSRWTMAVAAWHFATGKEVDLKLDKNFAGGFLAFTSDNQILTFELLRDPTKPDGPKQVAIVNRSTGQRVQVFETGERDQITAHVALSPDGKTFADARYQSVKLWDVGTGKALGTLDGAAKAIRYAAHTVAFSPDGRLVAVGSGTSYPVTGQVNGAVAVWEVKTRKLLRVMESKETQVEAITFSPDGKRLAGSGMHGSAVRVWDTETGAEVATFKGGGPHPFLAVTFSPDGKTLAANWRGPGAGDTEAGVAIWDVARGGDPIVLKGLREIVHAVTFSPDGRMLAAGDSRGNVKLWENESRK